MVVFFLGKPILNVFYTSEYTEGAQLLFVLSFYGLITCVGDVVGSAIIATRRFWIPLPVNTLGLITAVVASALLVPVWGLRERLAIALIMSALLRTALFAVILTKVGTSNRE